MSPDLNINKEKIVYQQDVSAKTTPQFNLKGHGEADKAQGTAIACEQDSMSGTENVNLSVGGVSEKDIEETGGAAIMSQVQATSGGSEKDITDGAAGMSSSSLQGNPNEDLSLEDESHSLDHKEAVQDKEVDIASNLLDQVGRPNTITCSELDWDELSSIESDCEESTKNDSKRKAERMESSHTKQKKSRGHKFHLY